jgi:LicD family protein
MKPMFFLKRNITQSFFRGKKKLIMIMTIVTIAFLMLLALITCVLISWVVISHDRFSLVELKPNCEYSIKDRRYKFPDIQIEGKCLLLKEKVIENLRDLMTRVHDLMNDTGIDYHISGGTLLGAVRHGTVPLPNDDDLDIHVGLANRDFMFGNVFREKAREHGLETQFLAGTTLSRADRHGSAVRLQLLNGGEQETCDVFFLQQEGDTVYKVDGWLGTTFVYNSKEQFAAKDVYPRKVVVIDGLAVCLPQNPHALLYKQYGADVLKCMKTRPRLISHAFPMRFLEALWKPTI